MLFIEDLLNGSFFKLVLMLLNWFMVFLNDFGGEGGVGHYSPCSWLKPLMVSQHLAKFHGWKPCDSREISYLICHRISSDHVFIGPFDFMPGSPFL